MADGSDAASRAERKRARLAAPPPELDPDLARFSLAELRAQRSELTDYETRVSYWRRIIQARLDLLREGRQPEDLDRLAEALADAPSRGHRMVNLAILPSDQVPPLPGLAELWQRTPAAGAETEAYLVELSEVEGKLSDHRRHLHHRIDAIHHELIARYRQEPALALDLLPAPGILGD